MLVRDKELCEEFDVSGIDDTFSFKSDADGLGLISSRYAHARPPSRYLRHYQTKCPHVTWHMTAWHRDSCDNVNSNISLLFCYKVSPQNVSILRDSEWVWGSGLRSISTSDNLHFHFNWHLDYQRFNFHFCQHKVGRTQPVCVRRLDKYISRRSRFQRKINFVLFNLCAETRVPFTIFYLSWT